MKKMASRKKRGATKRPLDEEVLLRHMQSIVDSEFENLVGEALSEICGRRFFCSRSGSQYGGDGSARGPFETVFEAKLYRDTTSLNQRNVLGGFVEATHREPKPDLWVLAASRPVPEQLERALRREAEEKAIGLLTLDAPPTGGSDLVQLIAMAPKAAALRLPAEAQAAIDRLRREPNFSGRALELRQKLSGPDFTLATLRAAVDAWWRETMSEPQKLVRRLRARPAPGRLGDPWAEFVRRDVVDANSASIKAAATKGNPCFFVGDEGVGKTLSALHWLLENASETLLLPVTKAVSVSKDPITLMSCALSMMLGRSPAEWVKKAEMLLSYDDIQAPIVTLFLDGLNERRKSDWTELLTRLQDEPYRQRVRVLATCRPYAFEHDFNEFVGLSQKPQVIRIGLFADAELDRGLKNHKIPRSSLSDEMTELLRRPRLFDLALRYREELEKVGEFTPARLYWEDWKDRLARNRDILAEPDFKEALRQVAKAIDKASPNPSRIATADLHHAVRNANPFADNPERVLQTLTELVDGGLAERSGEDTRLTLSFAAFALGWDLWRRALELPADWTIGQIVSEVRSWIEPWGGASFDCEVLRVASWAAALADGRRAAQAAIFALWLDRPNLSDEHEDDILAISRRINTALVDVAEYVWFAGDAEASERLSYIIRPLTGASELRVALIERARHWAGLIGLMEWPFLGQTDDRSALREKRLERLRKRLGDRLVLNKPFKEADETLTIADGEEPDGSHAFGYAVSVLAFHSRDDLMPLIRVWSIAGSVRYGDHDDKYIAALLRGAEPSEIALVDQALSQAQSFTLGNDILMAHAAGSLGWAIGTPQAMTVVADAFDKSGLRDERQELIKTISVWERPATVEEAIQKVADQTEKPHVRLSYARDWLLHPKMRLPESLVREATDFARNLDVTAIYQSRGHTSESLALEHWMPVLARAARDDRAAITRRLSGHVAAGQVSPERAMFVIIMEMSVLDAADLVPLMSIPGDDPDSANLRMAAQFLLAKDGDEQISLLLSLEPSQVIYRDLALTFSIPSATGLDALAKAIHGGLERNRLRSALFLVAATGVDLTNALRTALLERLRQSSPHCRAPELEILAKSDAPAAAAELIALDWTVGNARDDDEAFWGSLVLAKASLSLNEVVRRLHPRHLVRAAENTKDGPAVISAILIAKLRSVLDAEKRPLPATSISNFATDDTQLETRSVTLQHGLNKSALTLAERFRLGFDADARQEIIDQAIEAVQRSDQSTLASGRRRPDWTIPSAGLETLWTAEPTAFEAIADFLSIQSADNLNQLAVHEPGLLYPMVSVGLKCDPIRFASIWRNLLSTRHHTVYRTNLGSDWLLTMPFACTSPKGWALQIEAFDFCENDRELLDCTLHAETPDLQQRLIGWTISEAQSPSIWRRGRAMIVRGYLGLSSPRVEDLERLDIQASWLGNVWRYAEGWRERRRSIVHWLEQFRSADNGISASADFELLKSSADRRVWRMLDGCKLNHHSQIIFERQRSELKRAIEKREKDMGEKFLDQKLVDGLWPRNMKLN
ncbi:hypothetical protein NKH70_34545 [Mesorhizobium sp. M0991]|uniref:hypothetical protein n=1 Tax=Mesorhizobium sp. M0991 TaxID=2957043 RepID=UPI0033367902